MQSVIHAGWLVKRGGVRRSWKKRWFVFYANGTLEYYTDKSTAKNPDPKRLGKIDLTKALSIGATIEQNAQPFSVDLVTKARIWTLSCGTRDNQNVWLTLLSDSVNTYDNRLETAKEGKLVKQGAKVKNWKERYFILSLGNAVYFKTEGEALKFRRIAGASEDDFTAALETAKGCIPLKDASVKDIGTYENNKHCFSLSVPGRVYRISAKSKNEVDEWIAVIKTQMPHTNRQFSAPEPPEEKKVDSDSDFDNDDADVPIYVDRRITMSNEEPSADGEEPPGLPREPTISGTYLGASS